MSCCVSKLDLCRLIQESYKSPTFNFGDTDVTNDTFVYKVKIAGESFTEYPCTVIAPNIVVIDEYTLPVGNYIHEMLWTSANGTELIFQGALKITSVGSCCGSNRNNTIKVIQNETVVRINLTESNITIENGEWGSIDGDINEQTDLIELVDNAVNDMATQTWVENQNYLTEETDPTVPSHVKSITTTDISNWNGKQNQLTAGTNISIVGNTISSTIDLTGYATETWVNSQGFSKFSGNYNDLTNKPTIPTVGSGTITITQGGISKGAFTTNQSNNTTIEVEIPTLQEVAEAGNIATIPLKAPYAIDDNDVINFGQIKQWGIGTDQPVALNLNSTRPSGFYNFNPSVGGTAPFGWGSLVHIAYKGDTGVLEFAQLAIEQGGSKIAFRNKDAITINPWRNIWTDNNFNPNSYALLTQVYTRTQANSTFVTKTTNGDIELPAGKGLILRDDNGVRWKLKPSITGESIWTLAT